MSGKLKVTPNICHRPKKPVQLKFSLAGKRFPIQSTVIWAKNKVPRMRCLCFLQLPYNHLFRVPIPVYFCRKIFYMHALITKMSSQRHIFPITFHNKIAIRSVYDPG